ncbi:MAG TPA: hypothetical protein VFT58_02305 [Nitrososphaera sp.]|nr:hypothetical protein [Nitrososphaera sp.]
MRCGGVSHRVVVVHPSEKEPYALKPSIDGGWCPGLVVNEVSSKRRQVDSANLIEWRWMSVMDPAKPGPKPIDVIQVGGHRSRCQVAFNEMVSEGFQSGRIDIRRWCLYYTHNISPLRPQALCI